MKVQKIWSVIGVLMLAFASLNVSAQASVASPHQVVEKVTTDLLAEVKKAQSCLNPIPISILPISKKF